MQFKIGDQEYFLAFVDDERRWYVFSPTAAGMQKFPVYVDAVKFERAAGFEAGSHKGQS